MNMSAILISILVVWLLAAIWIWSALKVSATSNARYLCMVNPGFMQNERGGSQIPSPSQEGFHPLCARCQHWHRRDTPCGEPFAEDREPIAPGDYRYYKPRKSSAAFKCGSAADSGSLIHSGAAKPKHV